MRKRARMLAVMLVGASILGSPVRGEASAPAGFVQRSGSGLTVDGQPWKAIGVNAWDLDVTKTLAGDISGCYYQRTDLDSYFNQLFAGIKAQTGATVVRTFGFIASYTGDGADWSSTDKLLYYARLHGIRVIPVLGNQYGVCGSYDTRTSDWYLRGYREDKDGPFGDYRSYAVRVASRYKDDPTIAFWQLLNESYGDATALQAFSRDMVAAIRTEAGDSHHLINLGTVGAGSLPLPGYAEMLACTPTTGGCNDLAEAHVYNAADALPGRPFTSSVTVQLRATDSGGGSAVTTQATATVDGWVRLKVDLPPTGPARTKWQVRVTRPGSGAWTAYLDDAVIVTEQAPEVYGFESGSTEGFTSTDVAIAPDGRAPRTGLWTLGASIPATATTSTVAIDGPTPGARPVSIEVWARAGFRAPAPEAGTTIAQDHHAAVVSRKAPFVLGEAAYEAAVPSVPGCAAHRSLGSRALAFDDMLRLHVDPVYGGSGVIVWDWKDGQQTTRPNGSVVADPTVSCWTVTPGDPTADIVKTWAGTVPTAPLPPPAPLPSYGATLVNLRGVPTETSTTDPIAFRLRLSQAGNPIGGATVRASSGCDGSGVTDALGIVNFSCTPTTFGDATIVVSVDPGTCACSPEPLSFPVLVKRLLAISAASSVVTYGDDIPMRVTISDPAGISVEGAQWSVPGCGRAGEITESAPSATVDLLCKAASGWRGVKEFAVRIAGTDDVLPSTFRFNAVVFERVYRDAAGRGCIGYSTNGSAVGLTKRAGVCDSGLGSFDDWQVTALSETGRLASMHQVDGETVLTTQTGGYRVDGRFQHRGWDRSFTASVFRPSDGWSVWSA